MFLSCIWVSSTILLVWDGTKFHVQTCKNPSHKIPIDLRAEPDVLKEVKQKLDLGSVKFEVWTVDCLWLYIVKSCWRSDKIHFYIFINHSNNA